MLAAHAVLEAKVEAIELRTRETAATVFALNDSHTAFEAEAGTMFSLLRWAGATAVAVMLAAFGTAYTVVRSTMSVEAKLEQQQKSLDEIKRDVNELRRDVNEIKGKQK
ncbi:MAG TPA: hypothetical protein VGE74_11805 [Gemmata sp.]